MAYYDQSLRKRVNNCCRAVLAFFFAQIGVCGLVVCYTILGAFLFLKIESPPEMSNDEVASLRRRYVNSLWNVTYKFNVLHEVEWRSEIDSIILEYRTEIIKYVRVGYYRDDLQRWTFAAALMYCLSVYTTIGYGNLAPKTYLGKAATILYALVGIPLMLLYMTNLGDILGKSFKYIYSSICGCRQLKAKKMSVIHRKSKSFKRFQQSSFQMAADSANTVESACMVTMRDLLRPNVEQEMLIVPCRACIFVMTAYVAGGGLLFAKWENWNYIDGSYFCFISLVTVGLGDFVPGRTVGEYNETGFQLKLVACYVYVLFGMAMIAMCFNLMQEEVLHFFRVMTRRFGMIKK